MRFARATLLLCCAVALYPATLERMSVEEMAQQATAVARGRIGEPQSARFGALVYTLYPFEVEEQWSGPAIDVIDAAVPGGTYEGTTYRFSGAPELTPGAEYVLFLWTGPSGRTQIVGLSQGVFRVERGEHGAVALQASSEGAEFVDGDAPADASVALDGLAAAVLAATSSGTR